jgi:hypothetical protein
MRKAYAIQTRRNNLHDVRLEWLGIVEVAR